MLRLMPAWFHFYGHFGYFLGRRSPTAVWRTNATCAYLINYAQVWGGPCSA